MDANRTLAADVSQPTWAARLRRVVAAPLLLWLLLALPAVGQAQFTYTTNNNQITITGYAGAGSELIIPETINGLPVTTIGAQAFFQRTSLTGVTIPNRVTTIGTSAFAGCTGLTSVTIPNSVTTIGGYAFEVCPGLTSVTIPDSVTAIGNYAFYYCTGLTNVTIPNSVTTIGGYAFAGCTGLGVITVTALNPVCSSVDGVLFDKSQATLVLFPEGIRGSYTIPNNATSIGDQAFSGCTGLTNLTI